jgi:ATP-dependent Lhr-like helicase
VVTRDLASAEAIPGDFGAVYEVLKAMEERGRIRRGLFASQVGALQFALPAAVDLLRALREPCEAAWNAAVATCARMLEPTAWGTGWSTMAAAHPER